MIREYILYYFKCIETLLKSVAQHASYTGECSTFTRGECLSCQSWVQSSTEARKLQLVNNAVGIHDSFINFCLVILSIIESRMLKSLTVIVKFFSLFYSMSFSFLYFILCFSCNLFIIFIFSWWFHTSIIIKCPTLCLGATGILKPILSDIRVANPLLFWLVFLWCIFFCLLTSSL